VSLVVVRERLYRPGTLIKLKGMALILLGVIAACTSGPPTASDVRLLSGDRHIVYLRESEVRRLGGGKENEAVMAYLLEWKLLPVTCAPARVKILSVGFLEGGNAQAQFECPPQ